MDTSHKSGQFEDIEVIGVKINTLTIDNLNLIIAETVRNSGKIIIAHHNLHSVYLFHKNEEFKSFF
jgi:N-acetylglucosaminyldiphosphoundecaprenol N-acetyl-beta-D-mannosaminyltransferase